MGGVAVIVAQADFSNTDALARALAAQNKIPLVDARRQALHCWGIPWENIEPADGAALCSTLEAAGIPAVTVPIEALSLPAAQTARGASLNAEGMEIATRDGKVRLAWAQVLVAAAATLASETTRTQTVMEGPSQSERAIKIGITMVTGIPLGFGGKKEVQKTTKTTELTLRMDIFTREAHYQADVEKFDFSYLGDRRQHGAFANFRALAADLAQRQLVLNKGIRAIRAGQALSTLGYNDPSDYERECRWLYALTNRSR